MPGVAYEQLKAREKKTVDKLVRHFDENREFFSTLLRQLVEALRAQSELRGLVHSFRSRVKESDHLREKLARKTIAARSSDAPLDITTDNLFTKITDLAGCRILHLYTKQLGDINRCLQSVFEEEKYEKLEGPSARTWDDETREYFESIKVDTVKSKSLYTSVHYVIAPNKRTPCTCEVQVRTLAEEIWGEVNHAINYPHLADSVACREQIAVLARVTSSCSRLVDAIFTSHNHNRTADKQ